MASLYDSLYNWAKATTTSFADLRVSTVIQEELPAECGLIYRLRHWPDLSVHQRTADVFRTLSVMSHRPVNRQWILSNSRLQAKQVDRLLQRLVEDGAVEVIDGSKFPSAAAQVTALPVVRR